MAKLTPQQAAAKWSQNAAAAASAYREGVQRVTESPGVAAARQRQLWLAKVQASQEKWARRVASVQLGEWQQKTAEIGSQRFAQGVGAAQGKMEGFMAEFLPYVENAARQVRAMPKGDLEASIARAAQMIRANSQFRRGSGGR